MEQLKRDLEKSLTHTNTRPQTLPPKPLVTPKKATQDKK